MAEVELHQEQQSRYLNAQERLRPPPVLWKLGRFFWPGDANFGPLQWLDFLSYPTEITDACNSAERLAGYLSEAALYLAEKLGVSVTRVVRERCLAYRETETAAPPTGRVLPERGIGETDDEEWT